MSAKIQVRRHNDVIVVTSQCFCYHCVEYIKLDTCAKFHDHRSNNNKVMMGWALMAPPMTDGSKKPMSIQIGLKAEIFVDGSVSLLKLPRGFDF